MRLFLLLAGLIGALPAVADTATVAEGARVNLRSGKLDTYRVVKALEPGTELEVLRQEQTYVQVKTSEGDIGWLPLRLVRISVAPTAVAPPPKPETATTETPQAEHIQNQITENSLSPWIVVAVGLVGLIVGVVLGMAGLWTYYRKKLNGLRI